jgi:hypothetical protein
MQRPVQENKTKQAVEGMSKYSVSRRVHRQRHRGNMVRLLYVLLNPQPEDGGVYTKKNEHIICGHHKEYD